MNDISSAVILGIDTSGERPVVTLSGGNVKNGAIKLSAHGEAEKGCHNVALISQSLISSAGLKISDLEALAVSIGPGSFTGLRVGLAYAKGLAAATGATLVGVSHFERVLTCGESRECNIMLIPMKNDVYYIWRRDVANPGEKTQNSCGIIEVIDGADNLKTSILSFGKESSVVCVGFDANNPLPEEALVEFDFTEMQLTPESLIVSAVAKFARGSLDDWSELEPVYGRKSMAEINFERREQN